MHGRFGRGALAVLVGAALVPVPALAAPGTRVVVHLTYDGAHGADAACRLGSAFIHLRPVPDETGQRFENVGAGSYTLDCVANGFEPARVRVLVREDDAEVRVDVQMHARLREIGRTTARPASSATTRTLTRSTPLGKLSQDLYDLVNSVGGARVLFDSSGSLTGISLQGRDPRLTQYGFDGTRIPEPGALRALDADLLQSVSIDDVKSEADFYTLAPTTYPEYTLRRTLGGFGLSSLKAGIRGSAGALGYVLQGTAGAQRSALDGATYLDTSGLDYVHRGAAHHDGVLAKLSAPLNDRFTATAETLVRSGTTLPVDTFFAGPLPSGAGPGNVIRSSSQLSKVELEGDLGRWHAKFDATTIRTRQSLDYADRIVAGQPLPFRSDNRFDLNILDASLIDFITEGKTLNVNYALSQGVSTFASVNSVFGNAFASNDTTFRPDRRLQVSYVRRPTPLAQESLSVTMESRAAGNSALYVEGSGSVGTRARRVFATLGLGGHAVSPGATQPFDDPAAAQYDCDGGVIRAHAPNDQVSAVHERHLRLGGLLGGARGSLSVQAYETRDAGATVTNAATPLAAFPAALVPPSFAAALLAGYGTFGRCGAARSLPAIYLLRDVSGVDVEYRGVDVAASLKPSHALTLQGSLQLRSARLRTRSGALSAPDSPFIVGAQLPGVEPLDASLTADYGLHDRRTELLANATYAAKNNANGVPAYWLLTLGGVRKLSPAASVTAVATNVSQRYVDAFSSLRFAVPLPTVAGGRLMLPAAPLVQPQLFVTLDMKVAREP